MKTGPFFLLALLAGFCFAPISSAVSSSEALAALGACLEKNNPQLQPMGQTFSLQDSPHYVFYYPLASPGRMVAAVRQEDGLLIRDPDGLKTLAGGIYNDLILRESIRSRGFSADAIQTAVDASLPVLDDQYAKVQVFVSQINDKYPKLSFQNLQRRLEALRANTDLLKLQLSDTISEEQLYLNYPSAEGSFTVIRQYNTSFNSLFGFISAYDEYSKAITDVERQLYEQSVPDPDNKNINTNLENLRDIGISSLYAKAKASDPRKTLAGLLSQSGQWVQDSVSSFQFQDLSCRSNSAYDEAVTQYNGILKNEALLSSVGLGLDVKNVKTDWLPIEQDHDKRTAESYADLLERLPKVKTEMDQLTARYNAIIAPTTTPNKPTQQSDPTIWIILVLVLALGAYGVYMYRKKQQEESEGGFDSDAGHH
ncbi:hypothetical protein HY994_02540 [Candidatus Micrarchaeota archaeon]|nr:hypothetical protein [Candidatus Micrarchaeota archaeon]